MAERSENKAILVRRLGADAETRYTQNGMPVSRVSVAMNRQWGIERTGSTRMRTGFL
jgi:single-stranded DNA-binding protein